MAQHEGDVFVGAEVGQPVPAEDALCADDEILTIGRDRPKERLGLAAHVAMKHDRARSWSRMQRYTVRAWRSIPQ